MADADPPAPLNSDECREPTLEDLVKLCHALNQAGARYLVVGGFAIRAAGFARNTMDVDYADAIRDVVQKEIDRLFLRRLLKDSRNKASKWSPRRQQRDRPGCASGCEKHSGAGKLGNSERPDSEPTRLVGHESDAIR